MTQRPVSNEPGKDALKAHKLFNKMRVLTQSSLIVANRILVFKAGALKIEVLILHQTISEVIVLIIYRIYLSPSDVSPYRTR